jgi:hypothetical protein
MTKELASAVKALAATAKGVGYNVWDVDGTKTEIRPAYQAAQHSSMPGFTVQFGAMRGVVSPVVALALVREAACRGKEIMLWQCCACGSKEDSKALGGFVSHGYCEPCATRLRNEALAFFAAEKSK